MHQHTHTQDIRIKHTQLIAYINIIINVRVNLEVEGAAKLVRRSALSISTHTQVHTLVLHQQKVYGFAFSV